MSPTKKGVRIKRILFPALFIAAYLCFKFSSENSGDLADEYEEEEIEEEESIDSQRTIPTVGNTTLSQIKAAPSKTHHKRLDPGIKTILYYTPFFALKYYGFGGTQKPFLEKCQLKEQTQCYATNKADFLEDVGDFDALIFHPFNFFDNESKVIVPTIPSRKPHQRYVMFSKEAPLSPRRFFYGKYSERRPDFDYASLQGFFNWTMTYRLDSDIPVPHGWFEPLGTRKNVPINMTDLNNWIPFNKTEFEAFLSNNTKREYYDRVVGSKTKMVAWIVSHCWTNSNRESFARELSKYVAVDVFGGCTNTECDSECKSRMGSQHKFYLAIENNMCKHYVTEKFWQRMNVHHMVPIVIGSAEHYKQMAPPHSYIQAEDFASIKDLADYLKYLDQNDSEFKSYFWWHDHYYVRASRDSMMLGMCQLCQMLHDENQPEKVVHDLEDWWWTQSQCKPFPEWK